MVEWGSKLAKRGISKLFTIDLIDGWIRDFGYQPVTFEDLMNCGSTHYNLLRAAGVNNPMFGRSAQEIRHVKAFFAYFEKNPLPTRDGLNNVRLERIEGSDPPAWRIVTPDQDASSFALMEAAF